MRLNDVLTYLLPYILGLFLFITFTMAKTPPNNILLQSQSPLNQQLFWMNLESKTLQYPYMYPVIEPNFISNPNYNFYQKWHKFNMSTISFRSTYSLLSESNSLSSSIFGTIHIRLNKYLHLQNDFALSDNFNSNQHFDGQIVQSGLGWAGYLQNSSLLFYDSGNYFILANGNIFTSPFRSSLLINADIPPYTYFFWHQNIESLKFDWSLIFLEQINNKQRFISLHRYAYEKSFCRVGFTELILLAYDKMSGAEIEYILPSSVLLESEVNGSLNSNLIWCLDFSIKYYGYTLISELLIDDISIDGNSPQRLAFQIGVGYARNNSSYFIKYTRLNRWVGNYYLPELRFTYYDKLIGHPLGPDAHSLEISFYKKWKSKINFTGQIVIKELGASDINDWPKSMLSSNDFNFGYSEEPFPSSPIFNEQMLKLSMGYLLFHNMKIDLSVDYSSKTNIYMKFRLNLVI